MSFWTMRVTKDIPPNVFNTLFSLTEIIAELCEIRSFQTAMMCILVIHQMSGALIQKYEFRDFRTGIFALIVIVICLCYYT